MRISMRCPYCSRNYSTLADHFELVARRERNFCEKNITNTSNMSDQVSVLTRDDREDEAMAIYDDILKDYRLYPNNHRRKSWFVIDTNMLYYLLHVGDTTVKRTHFIDGFSHWHPYISRIYFGILAVVQTARCMQEANSLSLNDELFLQNFLSAHPPETLKIPGFLMPFFKSICCSKSHYECLGCIYPRLPETDSYHPRDPETGAPKPNAFSYKLPNIPQLIGFVNRLIDVQPSPSSHSYRPFNPVIPYESETGAIVNGYDWAERWSRSTSDEEQDEAKSTQPNQEESAPKDDLEWYFCTPGLMYPIECSNKLESEFAQFSKDLGLPLFDSESTFETLEKYLGMESGRGWFFTVAGIMSNYASYFKASGDLSQCSLEGPGAGQVEIHYKMQEANYKAPIFPGDACCSLDFEISARTLNTELSGHESGLAFLSHLNTVHSSGHPYLGCSSAPPNQFAGGPFWNSCSIYNRSNTIPNQSDLSFAIRKYGLNNHL